MQAFREQKPTLSRQPKAFLSCIPLTVESGVKEQIHMRGVGNLHNRYRLLPCQNWDVLPKTLAPAPRQYLDRRGRATCLINY